MNRLFTFAILAAMCLGINSFAGTQAGDMELGIQAALSTSNTDYDGGGDETTDSLIVAGKIGYFFTDALSLGITTTGVWASSDDSDSTLLFLELESNYHFMTDKDIVPYVGPHVGMLAFEDDYDSETVLTYGAQAGVKAFVSENVALDFQLRWTHYELDDFDSETDTFSLLVGVNVYF